MDERNIDFTKDDDHDILMKTNALLPKNSFLFINYFNRIIHVFTYVRLFFSFQTFQVTEDTTTLSKSATTVSSSSTVQEDSSDLATALARALSERSKVLQQSESEEEDDNEEENDEDDDDW